MWDIAVTLLAFSLDFCSTLVNQIGFCMQKLSHFDEEKKKQTESSDKSI